MAESRQAKPPTEFAMQSTAPHYLLLTEGGCPDRETHWRFVLQGIDSPQVLSATDSEPQADAERAELLAVVRGLEALEEPARVTLVTRSRYVQQGLSRGLQEWRDNDWQWERFGRLVPVRDYDLWQRIDQALRFHQLECRCWRFDEAQPVGHHQSPSHLAGPHFLRRRAIRYRSEAACSASHAEASEFTAPIRRKRTDNRRWVTGTVQRFCATAARAVSSPLSAS